MRSAARGQYKLKGVGRIQTSVNELEAYRSLVEFPPHEEKVISVLGRRDKGKGVVCPGGLWTGVHGEFLIKEVESPRHVWTKKEQDLVES